MIKIILFLAMVFIHCMLDFHQGDTIANMKQKSWWEKHPNYKDLYKYDFIAVLIVHGFSWSFGVQIPILLYNISSPISNHGWILNIFIIIINGFIHSYIDHLKANKMYINLVQDQTCHLLQMILSWMIYFIVFNF